MKVASLWMFIGQALAVVPAQSTQGVLDLVTRRMPDHITDFEFSLTLPKPASENASAVNDQYTISARNGRINIEGNSPIALASGLHRYLADVVHVDIWWFIGSQLDPGPSILPRPSVPMKGSSVVPWRYHFNTVTFSYTASFWTWEDWELQLDWMALHGVNLPLAWVGQEKILLDVYREIGMTDSEIISYFSGPAFQSWQRFGNIEGSWGGEMPLAWIDAQFELQRNITRRMVELGMTPILPCFTGFVPRALSRVAPNASMVNGSDWGSFGIEYSNVTFLEPNDPLFTVLQRSFISKQAAALGNITHIYTLDQYNENTPFSGDLNYLRNISYHAWQSLKSADPSAIWLMQNWLFVANPQFWTDARAEAYLSGIERDNDLLILDLFAESAPQWQRLNSYYGKPWIWCQVLDFGGGNGLYGQIENVTKNSMAAFEESGSMVGMGLTPEGQAGNEIMFDLLLDQAWSPSPIFTPTYFSDWVSRRYSGNGLIPDEIYEAWEMMRGTVYNNTNSSIIFVTKSVFEISPNATNMVHLADLTGPHSTILTYNPELLVEAWVHMFNASKTNPELWNNPGYQHDIVDITRQVLSNSFAGLWTALSNEYTSAAPSNATLATIGQSISTHLATLDQVLATTPSLSLSTWVDAAKSSALTATSNTTTNATSLQDFFAFNARNQITLWGPNGQISDYSSRGWAGLISTYYAIRWSLFVDYIMEIPFADYNETEKNARLRVFELEWQTSGDGNLTMGIAKAGSLQDVIEGAFERF